MLNEKLQKKIVEKFGSQGNFSTYIKEDEWGISRVIHGRKFLKPNRQAVWAELLTCKPEDIFKGPVRHVR